MSKKKHPEHVNHERWLVSYADFITLLFAFFVVLFASGQSDKAKQKKVSVAISNAFTQMAMFDSHSPTPPLADTGGNIAASPVALPIAGSGNGGSPQAPAAISAPVDSRSLDPRSTLAPSPEQQLRERVQQIIQKQLTSGGLRNQLDLHATAEGLTLTLHEGGFFDSGSAELRPASMATLTALAATLPSTPIRIEGHTDNIPMRGGAYATNWELSSARASAITRFLLEHSNVNPSQLSAAGYAEFHPIAPNTTPEGRNRNRRVDIVFLQPPAISPKI